MTGEISPEKVNVFDYSQDCHVIGDKGSDGFTLYHYGTQKEITLKVEGKKFSGFDSDTAQSFSGTINGKTIVLFDYETRKNYNFVLR